MFKHIFVNREYGPTDCLTDVRLIIDCGANAGYASAYFLSVHPNAICVSIEPDPENFALLQKNLEPYGSRAKCIRAGVWHRAGGLVMSSETFRDGGEWGRQVRECLPGEPPDFPTIDIATVVEQSGHERISLLKMDIEGAEAPIFSADVSPWLQKVDAIAIELHDDAGFGSATEIFHNAVRDERFRISRSGDMTICIR